MANDDHGRADPHIVRSWITGWTLARETPPPVPDSGGFRVDVGWPKQQVRYVFADLGAGLARLADTITDPWIFLKACVPPRAMRAILPARWVIQPQGFLMICDRVMSDRTSDLPDGCALDLSAGWPISIVKMTGPNADVVAIGRVVTVDEFAIYDRIETHPDYQRRGLASAVMKLLEGIARSRGTTRGALVATSDGRAFYEDLGWDLHSLYTTAVVPAKA